ncbi:MAG: hypothetical protein AAF806_14545 [Bacteroidota bacterium]
MYKNILFCALLLAFCFVQCTQESSELEALQTSETEQLIDSETQRWKENYAQFSKDNALNAFALSTADFEQLAASKAASFQFRLALDENMQLKAYAYALIDADGVLSDAELATVVIAQPINSPIANAVSDSKDLAENAIPASLAYEWNQNWLTQGQTWLQQHPLYSFTIPTASVHGLLKENPQGAIFHLGFDVEKEEPNLVLVAANQKAKDEGGGYYDFTFPCPTSCD